MSRFDSLESIATHLKQELEKKKYILLFAYNGTGKTRLSMAFKDIGKQGGNSDTLYFNAFTEDLFSWDNDLDGDSQRFLKLNSRSRFFAGLEELEMENRIRPFLHRYADFDFSIDYQNDSVIFSRTIPNPDYDENAESLEDRTTTITHIKISRGEENLFIWCFFLAIVQLALDGAEAYQWVKYVYIDDPISSLDENNAVAIGHHVAQLLKNNQSTLKTVISSHHTLFFNVLCNELSNANKYFLNKSKSLNSYNLKDTTDTPFFYHVAMLAELYKAAETGNVYTHHFNMLRIILEKTASFHGYRGFSHCIKKRDDDPDGVLHTRLINILNHGNYSLYEPISMGEENKNYFNQIINDFLENYNFNTQIFAELANTQAEAERP